MADKLLTPDEVAVQLSVRKDLLHRLATKGTGPTRIRVSGLTRYKQSDIDSWIASQTIAPIEVSA